MRSLAMPAGVVLGLFTLGLWTRATSVLACLITVSYANRLIFVAIHLKSLFVGKIQKRQHVATSKRNHKRFFRING